MHVIGYSRGSTTEGTKTCENYTFHTLIRSNNFFWSVWFDLMKYLAGSTSGQGPPRSLSDTCSSVLFDHKDSKLSAGEHIINQPKTTDFNPQPRNVHDL